MQKHIHKTAPVGVVPRRQMPLIETLMSDTPQSCAVIDSVESPGSRKPGLALQWLPTVTTVGIIAAVVDWLKLTR
ncbi:MAG: hypothetical protein MAG794_00638 [Gammaproteobacteria bacterium]|nr:hypothetical protein [Gammaproteobacteria bacterium]